jgi:hypothetical protein
VSIIEAIQPAAVKPWPHGRANPRRAILPLGSVILMLSYLHCDGLGAPRFSRWREFGFLCSARLSIPAAR